MRYIGGKSLLLDNIQSVIDTYANDVDTITDIFSGSGAVGMHLKNHGYHVISNDLLYFSYAIARGTIGVNKIPTFDGLDISDPISYLNNIDISSLDIKDDKYFIYHNYSPNSESDRMYFQNDNALRIDAIRLQIEAWKNDNAITEDEYYYLLASLLSAVPYVANITGTFGAYLKYWDKRTYNKLQLKIPEIITAKSCECHCGDYTKIFVMETIARYDSPIIKGITGIREYTEQKSAFCKKATVHDAFIKLIKDANSKYVLISYNNEGLISTEELSDICKTYGNSKTFKLIEMDYRRYKNKIPNNTVGLKEQLYFVERT